MPLSTPCSASLTVYLPPRGGDRAQSGPSNGDRTTRPAVGNPGCWDPAGGVLTSVVFAIQMGSVASVHPPAGALLLGAVAMVLVVVVVEGAELHAVVGRGVFVAGVGAKVEAVEGVSSVAAKVKAVHQAVLVGLRSDSEHVVVGVPAGQRRGSHF